MLGVLHTCIAQNRAECYMYFPISQIVSYHDRFYRLENVLAVIQGGTTAEEVVGALRETERRGVERGRDRIEGWEPRYCPTCFN